MMRVSSDHTLSKQTTSCFGFRVGVSIFTFYYTMLRLHLAPLGPQYGAQVTHRSTTGPDDAVIKVDTHAFIAQSTLSQAFLPTTSHGRPFVVTTILAR